MYLQRRNGHYWFRKATPLDLLRIVGQAEIRCSLRTNRRDVANRRATQLLGALENMFELWRSEQPLDATRTLLTALLGDLWAGDIHTNLSPHRLEFASTTLEKVFKALGCRPLPNPSVADNEKGGIWIDSLSSILYNEAPRDDVNRIAVDLVELAIRMRRAMRGDKREDLFSLCKDLASVSEFLLLLDRTRELDPLRAILRDEIARAGLGKGGDRLSHLDIASLQEVVSREVRAGVIAAGRDRWSADPLSRIIEKFLEARYPANKGKGQVGSKHRQDVERRLTAFLSFTGDLAVRDITRDHLKTYRDILDQLPDRFEARFKVQDMRLAIEKNTERKDPFPFISQTTVDLKWLGPVNRLFHWLVTEEKIEKNPADGIRSEQGATGAANTKRLPFKPNQISKLFAITSAASPKSALYWLPLLMLTTGARPNELAQLRTDDLYEDYNGRPHLNVLCLLDHDDEADPTARARAKRDQRRVKTAAGKRMIPLHPISIAAGFIKFVKWRHQGGAKPLFRELRPDKLGFWSSAITKRINRIVREKLHITNPRYSAYSLRHNFIDACRSAGITKETRMKIVGHHLEGVHGVYGNPNVLPHESKLIESVRFDGIDFALYLRS